MIKIIFLTLFTTPLLASTMIPFERDISRIPTPSFIQSSHTESSDFSTVHVGDANETLFYHGFSIDNHGPNHIVPTQVEDINYAYREFSFVNDDRSKRDTYLWLTDYNGSGRVSDYFETSMFFLPRLNQLHVEEVGEELVVTLTTGEEVLFSKKDKTIISGVMKEAPLDYNPDRNLRRFAQVEYTGEGIVIRSDVRAADPRLKTKSQILKKGLKPCIIGSDKFWTEEGFPKFKFVSDEEAYAVIRLHCGVEYLPN